MLCTGFDDLNTVELYFLYHLFPKKSLLNETCDHKDSASFDSFAAVINELINKELIKLYIAPANCSNGSVCRSMRTEEARTAEAGAEAEAEEIVFCTVDDLSRSTLLAMEQTEVVQIHPFLR